MNGVFRGNTLGNHYLGYLQYGCNHECNHALTLPSLLADPRVRVRVGGAYQVRTKVSFRYSVTPFTQLRSCISHVLPCTCHDIWANV